MVQRIHIGKSTGRWTHWKIAPLILILAAAIAMPMKAALSQGTFQIVWVVIGEASSVVGKGSAHAGRQLFMASDLVSRSMANVKIEQVEVLPIISEIAVGERLCLTAMNIRTLGPDKELVGNAPLSVSVRQDHKQQLGLRRSKEDICITPTTSGEFPLRLTSMLPARDGTTRGAQVFVRVKDKEAVSTAAGVN